jgi:hypothetical protein
MVQPRTAEINELVVSDSPKSSCRIAEARSGAERTLLSKMATPPPDGVHVDPSRVVEAHVVVGRWRPQASSRAYCRPVLVSSDRRSSSLTDSRTVSLNGWPCSSLPFARVRRAFSFT